MDIVNKAIFLRNSRRFLTIVMGGWREENYSYARLLKLKVNNLVIMTVVIICISSGRDSIAIQQL